MMRSLASLTEAVNQNLVSILSTIIDNLLFSNKRKSEESVHGM